MVGDNQVSHCNVSALLDPHVMSIAEVPGRGVADDVPIARLLNDGVLPEGVRHRLQAERGEEFFGNAEHFHD